MKKLFSSTKAYLLLAGAAALMASCQDYEPANEQMTKEAAYNYEFERQFGPVDPNHDWSMATRVTANIDLSDAPEGTYEVKIFSEKNGYLLTKAIVENSAQISFDAIKGESSVRILARKTSALGLSVINGYFPIVDGEVNTAKEGTRAPSTATQCNTTVGDQITDLGYYKEQQTYYEYHSQTGEPSQNSNKVFVESLNDGKYYIQKIAGESYDENQNGKYLVTHNTESSQKDMYEIFDIISIGNDVYLCESTSAEYDYHEKVETFNDGYTVENLPNDDWYYVFEQDNQSYNENDNGKYSVWYNGNITEYDMYHIEEILNKDNCKYAKKTSSGYTYEHWWKGTARPAYYSLNHGAGYFASTDRPAYYEEKTKTADVNYGGNFYYLNDVYMSIEENQQVLVSDLLPLVSKANPDAYFSEGIDNRTLYEDKLEPDIEFVLIDNGPVTFTPVFYASDYDNELGYFYWFETEGMTEEQKKAARLAAPRYVFMNHTVSDYVNASGEANITVYDKDGQKHVPGRMEMPNWVSQDWAQNPDWGTYTGSSYVQGTTYHLAYFGEDYEQEKGIYNFPKGVHVGFFFFASNKIRQEYGRGSGLFYSIEEMNLESGTNDKHWYGTGGQDPVTGEWIGEDFTRPDRAAVHYSYKGTVVMGIEDNTDYDENDILLFVSAPIIPPQDITKEKENTWIVACEDLGGTYDYDFNDLVFELTKNEITTGPEDPTTGEILDPKTTTIEWSICALAAGGTLPATVYYDNTAIGEIHSLLGSSDTGTPINVSPGTTPSIGTPVKLENVAEADQNEISNILGHIKIVVENKDENIQATVITAPNQDKTSNIPQMLLLPKGWDWPTEQTHIYNVYPKFKNWAADMTQNGWIEDPTEKGINTNYFIVNPNK